MEKFTPKQERIAIFGGSFDPVHVGHLITARQTIERFKLTKLIYLPIFINNFKKHKRIPVHSQHRFEMLKLICSQENEEVHPFALEGTDRNLSCTYMSFFREKYPNAKLYLLMGSDCFVDFPKWQNIERILEICQLIVFKRTKYIDVKQVHKYNALVFGDKELSFSSTNFREGDYECCPLPVRKYIAKNFLYLEEILKKEVGEYREKHSLKTAQICERLAKKLNFSPKRAYYAGLMHDLTKEWSPEQHQSFIKQQGIDIAEILPYEFHQLSAALWLQNVYMLEDSAIIRAISIHTTLDLQLSNLDKILFIADKISKLKDEEIDTLLEQNFDLLFAYVVEQNYKSLQRKGISLTPKQQLIYDKWRKGGENFGATK